ncbi:MAG: methionyl-tRNA formyltransferase [Acutalibacteraceae bacterium]|nr:methionyl-tRNA formyltransferase [Acutalibacteraceae bacterium]
MDIVFMGTPEFAVPCLERLISDGHNVKGVFTQPDKPKGRGHKMQFPPVKQCAVDAGIPVFQPEKMRDGSALSIIEDLNPELIIVVAYGKILPSEILNFPKYGCINMHASVLPAYRGAAPIQWSVLNGETVTGVTAMQMDIGLDTGDMLLTETVEIGQDETAGELHDKLSVLGAKVMSETIDKLLKDELTPVKQDDALSNYAPMLTKDLCPVNWNDTADKVHNKVRGLYPWPVAITRYNDKTVKIHQTAIAEDVCGEPGEVIQSDKKLIVCCGCGTSVEIVKLQLEGKKAMNASDFLRGNPIEKGTILK